MAEPTPLDPFALVRELVAQWEKSVNQYATPLMHSDEFAMGANTAMGAALGAKKLAQELSQRSFEAMNVASRADIIALGDRLQAIEDRMIGMQATLDRLAGGGTLPARPAPSRTRKPPQPVVEAAAAAPAPKPAPDAKP